MLTKVNIAMAAPKSMQINVRKQHFLLCLKYRMLKMNQNKTFLNFNVFESMKFILLIFRTFFLAFENECACPFPIFIFHISF